MCSFSPQIEGVLCLSELDQTRTFKGTFNKELVIPTHFLFKPFPFSLVWIHTSMSKWAFVLLVDTN